jgi:hypothetical protein
MKTRDYLLSISALTILGCADGRPEAGGPGDGAGATGIAVQALVEADLDVDIAHIQYTIDRVACTADEVIEPLRREVRTELRTLQLPAGIPAFSNRPLDGASAHQFADHFELLPAGCYDVAATPLTVDAAQSADCGAARRNGVQVRDGETTEIFLLSQCKGPEVGALDAVMAFNQPPQLVNLTYSPSKFIAAGESTTVCVTAADPNGDPLEFEWNQLAGGVDGESILSTQESQDASSQCVEIAPTQAGDFLFEVRIYDLLRDDAGAQVRIERALAENGSPNLSNDSLRFPVYAGTAAAQPEQPEEPEEPEVPEVPPVSQQ